MVEVFFYTAMGDPAVQKSSKPSKHAWQPIPAFCLDLDIHLKFEIAVMDLAIPFPLRVIAGVCLVLLPGVSRLIDLKKSVGMKLTAHSVTNPSSQRLEIQIGPFWTIGALFHHPKAFSLIMAAIRPQLY